VVEFGLVWWCDVGWGDKHNLIEIDVLSTFVHKPVNA